MCVCVCVCVCVLVERVAFDESTFKAVSCRHFQPGGTEVINITYEYQSSDLTCTKQKCIALDITGIHLRRLHLSYAWSKLNEHDLQ